MCHGFVIAALLWMPAPEPAELPGSVTVDLVALATPAAAGKPAAAARPLRTKPLPPAPSEAEPVPPAPKAAETPRPQPPKPEPQPKPEPKPEPPKPPPPPPPRNETVIPKTPQKEPEKPKEKPEPKPEPKEKPEPKPPREVAKAEPTKSPPKPAPPKPKPQESYDDVLAELRAERGEKRPDKVERPTRTASAAAAPGAGGTAAAPGAAAGGSGAVTPQVAAWLRAARLHVRQAWVLPAGMRRELLETQVEVELDAQGNVLSEPRVVRRSGNPWYDESVVRAVQKASPLPPPPEPGTWPFVFKPEDLG